MTAIKKALLHMFYYCASYEKQQRVVKICSDVGG
jgi:hypothetical protein